MRLSFDKGKSEREVDFLSGVFCKPHDIVRSKRAIVGQEKVVYTFTYGKTGKDSIYKRRPGEGHAGKGKRFSKR